ncbi:hypothetical protein [Hungatella effluvii]|uniref:hypothetical protein n=1 Tax=Hungatella effluvii TaxID=1096246 RepID=UPI0022E77FF2|nr:hypothetical protein [Hungatella effluvii]
MRNLTLTSLQTLANDQTVLCTKVEPIKDFVDGHYVEPIKGQKYECVLTGNGYDKITIKTEEIFSSITMEMIESNNGAIPVEVSNFVCKIYADRKTGNLLVSAKASTVQPAMEGGDDDDRIF